MARLLLPGPLLIDPCCPIAGVGLRVGPLRPPTALERFFPGLNLQNLAARVVFVGGVVGVLCSVVVFLNTLARESDETAVSP